MLVLTRKHQEKIRIGENIVITVLKTKGKAVRLGIEAPAEVPVIRGELSFEGHAIEWPAEAAPAEEPADSVSKSDRNHLDRIRNHWPTTKSSGGREESQVSFQRVSRDAVKGSLPTLEAGAGPLRAMLERRSVSA